MSKNSQEGFACAQVMLRLVRILAWAAARKTRFARAKERINGRKDCAPSHSRRVAAGNLPAGGRVFARALQGDMRELLWRMRESVSLPLKGSASAIQILARRNLDLYIDMQPVRFAKPARPAAQSPIRLRRGGSRRMLRILPRASPRPLHSRRRESPRRILR